MRVMIAGIGRMKAGADRQLLERYLERARKAGRAMGFSGPDLVELPESRAQRAAERKQAEAENLLAALPAPRVLVALDEGGRTLPSEKFADRIGRWRDEGAGALVFAIGGADGHGRALLDAADMTLAFGPMTWPHQLVRIMMAEQIYRAISILSGHPYHRA
ncbi:23S rRNA (pseudouridine1915-N3)-methyltransferase [Breoghania corrubedonensis]|uniref:Ribosomal RNA large subunit methyltransferase H n=1 Tax=Breoghania corrubedonensis TaxID=665038 RepID=A0A2T5VGL0_9HYPH|nr:23S rRNA (pseudouridine(1915)-N(3))-methyltransferase RlmH [Breoghania corrubedonensis]PTW62878.1 23S rRNA (pseudouridine1915-N3)-methyltransferase [Breoghania corrubedonensis]